MTRKTSTPTSTSTKQRWQPETRLDIELSNWGRRSSAAFFLSLFPRRSHRVIENMKRIAKASLCTILFLSSVRLVSAQATSAAAPLTPFQSNSAHLPLNIGVLAQGG